MLRHRLDDYNPDRSGGRCAYYSKLLLQAKEQKRIEFVPVDLLMQVRAYFDIGGTGARCSPPRIVVNIDHRTNF